MNTEVTVVGAGLAGSEAAWQIASAGVFVRLYEMRPNKPTPVHRSDRFAELVCSNSLRSDHLSNAHGLLKEEMRRLGSLVLQAAACARVPAGQALAVDRDVFAQRITDTIESSPLIQVVREEVEAIPEDGIVVLASGPLTSESLSSSILAFTGSEHLYFYDAVSPVVEVDTIDFAKAFRASRYGKGGDDYINCPMNREEYQRFYDALVAASSVDIHELDKGVYFESCLPVEVMASRGVDTLRFGPMKPVGLADPRTGREAYAVVQLRQDNLAATLYNIVGFQNQLKWGEQKRILRMVPGLESAEFARFGMIHRNTYINAPKVLHATFQTRSRDTLFFAGQISGVEGYTESAASGLIAGLNAAALALGRAMREPPETTALGALGHYISHADADRYQPTNIAFGLLPPLDPPVKNRRARKEAMVERALEALDEFIASGKVSARAG
ncbi:MAG: methylenetetrahydrofolate--tRNA-(uracil(54)-C(5))-methyltransferase (FADH(2)-oxidizing) TrmFO [Acidobacteriota bacterium]|nr:MAG: methylenetetrahydrofolate--tRNA-(uracil(54)-C(5))-methyltransferase (FADH(2)-oxidizing) TrmFO [Acidobacteriota bacterium]